MLLGAACPIQKKHMGDTIVRFLTLRSVLIQRGQDRGPVPNVRFPVD